VPGPAALAAGAAVLVVLAVVVLALAAVGPLHPLLRLVAARVPRPVLPSAVRGRTAATAVPRALILPIPAPAAGIVAMLSRWLVVARAW